MIQSLVAGTYILTYFSSETDFSKPRHEWIVSHTETFITPEPTTLKIKELVKISRIC